MRVSSASAGGRPKSRSGKESVEKVKSGWIGLTALEEEEGGDGVEAACARARVRSCVRGSCVRAK